MQFAHGGRAAVHSQYDDATMARRTLEILSNSKFGEVQSGKRGKKNTLVPPRTRVRSQETPLIRQLHPMLFPQLWHK